MLTYPLLNERPIDQWEITELKDELQQRNLPITGLKDDLVKRLSEDIQGEKNNNGETPPTQGLKGGATPGSLDVSGYQVSGEPTADEGVSEVTKQGDNTVTSVTGSVHESLVPITEASKEPIICTSESSQGTLNAVTKFQSPDDMAATHQNHQQSHGVGQESFSSGVTALKEVDPLSKFHNDTIDETPNDESSMKMAVVGISSDVSSTSIKLTEDSFIGTAEASRKTLDALSEVGSSLAAAKGTEGDHFKVGGADLASASIGNTVVKNVNPYSEGQGGTVEKNSEDDTSNKLVACDVPSDVISTDAKIGVDDVDIKLLEQKAVPTPSNAIVLHADNSDADTLATTVAETEDCTGKEVAIDEVSSDGIHANTDLGVDVVCKSEQEVRPIADVDCNIGAISVPPQADAIALHVDVAETATAVPKYLSCREITIDDVSSDATHANANLVVDADCKSEQETIPIVDVDSNIGLKKMSPPLDATAQADVVVTTENMIIENSVSENALRNNKDYEDSIHTNEDCKLVICESENQGLDGDTELHRNSNMEGSGFASSMDLISKEESPDDNFSEKHLDQNLGTESMDNVLMKNMHDVGGKTKVISEHVFPEVTPVEAFMEDSSGHIKEVVAEEKQPILTEKRKSEGHESIANEKQIKRRCKWDVDTDNISDQKASKLTGAGTPKVILSSDKRGLGRNNSTANGGSPKKRIVPPPKKPATTSLRIDQFVRPFTLRSAQEFLGKTGSICSFWMHEIKTHCYVTYSSVEEAVATRNAVYNLQWPPNNGSCLVADFVDPEEVKLKLALPPPPPVPINLSTTAPETTTCQQRNATQTIPPCPAATSMGLLPIPAPLCKLPPTSDPATPWESCRAAPEKLEPALKLDDLFRKTQAYPKIYYMPLSEEEVLAKNAAGRSTRRNS